MRRVIQRTLLHWLSVRPLVLRRSESITYRRCYLFQGLLTRWRGPLSISRSCCLVSTGLLTLWQPVVATYLFMDRGKFFSRRCKKEDQTVYTLASLVTSALNRAQGSQKSCSAALLRAESLVEQSVRNT